MPEFVIQGGCPEGHRHAVGPGYKFADEPVQGEYTLGAVAMANAGPDTNGSQFFVCIDDCQRKLSKNYNLFGYVVEGIDVAQATQVGDVMQSVAIEETRRPRRESAPGSMPVVIVIDRVCSGPTAWRGGCTPTRRCSSPRCAPCSCRRSSPGRWPGSTSTATTGPTRGGA